MKALLIISVFCLTVIFNVSGQITPQEMLNKAIYQEEVNGNLDEAIKLFLEIVDKNSTNRAVTVEAFYHLGLTNEKLGNKKAKEYYEKIVNNFGDQPEFVRIARERLSVLTTGVSHKEIALRQVWAGKDVDILGSVSADGEYATYTDWNFGNLAIRNLKTGENKPLTNEGNWKGPIQYALFSLISPDGKQVAYGWYNVKGIWELRLLKIGSQTPVSLYSCVADEYPIPEFWFADGKKIIFCTLNEKNKIWQLSLINITDKEVRLLKEAGGISSPGKVSLSPDEKYIAYELPGPSAKNSYDIHLMSIDTKEESVLVENPSNDRLLGWIPGRNELLFASDRSNTIDIWAVNTSGEKSTEIPKRILTNIGDIFPMGFTRDGSLYYGINSNIFDSFILPFDQNTGKLSNTPRTALLGSIFDVSWLPDGESLICRKYSDDWILRLLKYNSKSGESQILANNLDIKGEPKISPDSKSVLAFGYDKSSSEDINYEGGIYSIDIKTGLPVKIKVKQKINKNGGVEWDKDGKNIFYINDNHLIKHNIETADEKIIFTNKNLFFSPALKRSFDGRDLLFDGIADTRDTAMLNEGEAYLLSIPEREGEIKILCKAIFSGGMLKRFTLTPDGKYIYFSAVTPPQEQSILCRIPATGGTPEKVWQSKGYRIVGISINPDGKSIALSTAVNQGEIRVIENLGRKVAEVFSDEM
jgi:Tol biopolymer transport system component